MIKTFIKTYLFLIILLIGIAGCSSKEIIKEEEKPKEEKPEDIAKITEEALEVKLEHAEKSLPFIFPPSAKIESINADEENRILEINLTKEFSYIPWRNETVKMLYKMFYDEFGFEDYKMLINVMGYPIEELVPNYYRAGYSEYDQKRMPMSRNYWPEPIVRNISTKNNPVNGLKGNNILLWPSHGWYYNLETERWEWQRPRLFQSVEDLITYSFAIPYLIPMLENSGARVFVPRERDIQTNEIVIDNDTPFNPLTKSQFTLYNGRQLSWAKSGEKAFGIGYPPYREGENPFKMGTYDFIYSSLYGDASCAWTPEIPKTGEYAVYISYIHSDENVSDAHYTVYHAGGKTEFEVNQQIGGSTWIYLGTFKFKKGFDPEAGKVVLSNKSKIAGKLVTADAVRFGGGIGIIERNGSTSGRPKFTEAARYWLQYAGMPDTLIFSLNNNKNDYTDDYQSRAEYGNYLYGNPYGPNVDRNEKGLGIPIDLSLAFHTDAGISRSDTTIGTLSIYSITSADTQSVFPDGVSRLANRDLADIVQTQIVGDLRSKYDPIWNRRSLMNARYSESVRPNFPSMLLELLSHQNFLDMKFVLDPRFRFDVSRAIYKGMLRFLSVEYSFDYVVQPLPVSHFSTEFDTNGNIILNWQPQEDPFEPTANPAKYIVYTRINNGGFDNGILVGGNSYTKQIETNKIYSFKVTAVNDGGESFPSEILSVCRTNNSPNPILIVNSFDRIAPPATVEDTSFVGFTNFIDSGVPDKYDINFTGAQYDFYPNSPYISNDAPGHGASSANYETKIIAGNTFDFPYVHGLSIKNAGYSFVSTSDEAVMDETIDIKKYKMVDLILGEEKKTHWQKPYADSVNGIQFEAFPLKLQELLSAYLVKGKNLFVSGAYAASDLFSNGNVESIEFAKKVLHMSLATNHAAKTGKINATKLSFLKNIAGINYSNELNDSIYAVEAPDAVAPQNGAQTILRYAENQFSAAIGYKNNYGVVVFGFPFETVLIQEIRNDIMKEIIKYFGL